MKLIVGSRGHFEKICDGTPTLPVNALDCQPRRVPPKAPDRQMHVILLSVPQNLNACPLASQQFQLTAIQWL
jgi:hypothetical protein